MSNLLLWLLLVPGLLFLLLAWRLRRRSGLPWAVVRFDDAGGQRLQRPLYAPRYGLSGKPDYVLERGQTQIPVELKPSRYAEQPYQADLVQLAAYCLLIEESSGRPPPYGLLRYAERSFKLVYTPAIRDQVLDMLEAMRADLGAEDCARSHEQPARCRGCGFRDVCEDALV